MAKPNITKASILVAQQIAAGKNVAIMDADHSNPNHATLLTDPEALKRYAAAGLKDIVIEVDAEYQNIIREAQEQVRAGTLNRAQLREMIGNTIPAGGQAEAAGKGKQDIDQRTDLIYETAKLGITIHCLDETAKTFDGVLEKLPKADREIIDWMSKFQDEKKLSYEEAIAVIPLERAQALGDALNKINTLLTEDRIAPHPAMTLANDERMAKEIAERTGGRPVLIMYGAGHLIGGRDLDDRLTAHKGNETIKILQEGDGKSRQALQPLFTTHQGAVDLPNYTYDPITGDVAKVNDAVRIEGQKRIWGHQRLDNLPPNACLDDIRNLMAGACSTYVQGLDVPNGTPVSPTATPAPDLPHQHRDR
jgi:hypothetical protein